MTIKEAELIKKAFIQARNIIEGYATHRSYCDIEMTEFCTCGLRSDNKQYRETLAELEKELQKQR